MWLRIQAFIVCRYAASVVTSVTYGRRVESVDEWIVAEKAKSMDCKLSYFVVIVLLIISRAQISQGLRVIAL